MFDQDFGLEGRVAVITGAANGIGRATAHRLAAAGARVVCADIDKDGLEATVDLIRVACDDDARAVGAALDVTDASSVAELIDSVVADHGRIDVLGNIAGIMMNTLVADVTETELDNAWAVNFKGTFLPSQAAARHMVAAGRGSIINISSSAIDMPTARYASYAVTKIAVAELTRIMAVELAPAGVRVNVIAPAYVNTNMATRHFRRPDGSIDEELRVRVLEETRSHYPLGILAEPEDIASLVHYLAADVSRVFTGQTFRPNGGVVMPA
jgi:3-oxoacyl-[acyl-carrier protein] reductase